MFSSLSDIIKIPATIIVGMILATFALVLYYEGVSLPIVGQVINGRVANAEEAARQGYVLLAEKAAAEAKSSEIQRQLDAAASAEADLEKQIQAASVKDAQQEKDREASITQYEMLLSQANRRCALSADDVSAILRVH